MDNQDEIVNVPVPKRYLAVVITALADAMREPSVEKSAPDMVATSDKSLVDWTSVENMRILRRNINAHVVLTLLDMTAEKPGVYIPFSDVVEKSNSGTPEQSRSRMGSLTKVIKREFKLKEIKGCWPIMHIWAYGGDNQYYYSMKPEIAKAWLASKVV